MLVIPAPLPKLLISRYSTDREIIETPESFLCLLECE